MGEREPPATRYVVRWLGRAWAVWRDGERRPLGFFSRKQDAIAIASALVGGGASAELVVEDEPCDRRAR